MSPRHTVSSNIDYSLPSDNYIHIVNQLRQNQASILTQLWTGHIPLNNTLYRIKQADSVNCPHCDNDTKETTLYYLFFCPHYNTARRDVLATTQQEKNLIAFLLGNRTGIPHLLRYVHNTRRFRPIFKNIYTQPEFTIKEKETQVVTTEPPRSE